MADSSEEESHNAGQSQGLRNQVGQICRHDHQSHLIDGSIEGGAPLSAVSARSQLKALQYEGACRCNSYACMKTEASLVLFSVAVCLCYLLLKSIASEGCTMQVLAGKLIC